jgi:hypothetical protein
LTLPSPGALLESRPIARDLVFVIGIGEGFHGTVQS